MRGLVVSKSRKSLKVMNALRRSVKYIHFFPYGGGDARFAKWIVDNLPEGEVLIEGFGGGASVSLESMRRGRFRKYVINELNPRLVRIYEAIKSLGAEVLNRLRSSFRRIVGAVKRRFSRRSLAKVLEGIIRNWRKHDVGEVILAQNLYLSTGKGGFLRIKRSGINELTKELGRVLMRYRVVTDLLRRNDVEVSNEDVLIITSSRLNIFLVP